MVSICLNSAFPAPSFAQLLDCLGFSVGPRLHQQQAERLLRVEPPTGRARSPGPDGARGRSVRGRGNQVLPTLPKGGEKDLR